MAGLEARRLLGWVTLEFKSLLHVMAKQCMHKLVHRDPGSYGNELTFSLAWLLSHYVLFFFPDGVS